MTDEQLEILKLGLENGNLLRKTAMDEGFITEISRETMKPIRRAFIEKYGRDEFRRLVKAIMPSNAKALGNATKALGRVIKATITNKDVLIDDEIARERLETCKSCPFLAQKGKQSVCTVCKCNVKAKTKLATESCPRNKWKK